MPWTIECRHPRRFRALRQSRSLLRPFNRSAVDVTQSAGWLSTALPLTTCLMVWGLGDTSPARMTWLPIAHDLLGAAASAWTILQITLEWVVLRDRLPKRSWPGPGLLVMYALLTLQPLLAVASSMLHGTRARLFWIPLPSVLPVNPSAALQVDRAHGINAIVLLGVIAWQVSSALRTVLFQRDTGRLRDDPHGRR